MLSPERENIDFWIIIIDVESWIRRCLGSKSQVREFLKDPDRRGGTSSKLIVNFRVLYVQDWRCWHEWPLQHSKALSRFRFVEEKARPKMVRHLPSAYLRQAILEQRQEYLQESR